MLFGRMSFIGIDPSAGVRPFVYAALDQDLKLAAIGQGRLDEVLAFTAGQQQAVTAICAPRRPNSGAMARRETRLNLTPVPHSGSWLDFRVADYLIRQRNLSIPQTYADAKQCPMWMQNGFYLYEKLSSYGYQPYPQYEAALVTLEVYPYAGYAALLGVAPFPKYTLEGRIQRQLALYEQQVKIPDPMQLFEEITRHKLLNGKLPTEHLFGAGELDALLAAYTAWLVVNDPDRTTRVGDAEEGEIVIPGALKEKY